MKRKLLAYSFLTLMLNYTSAQVTAGQVDDFEDGTSQNWVESSNTYVNISTDGPAGVNDNYLRDYTSGNPGGGGSRMILRNLNQWTGNYTSQGVIAIKLDVRSSDTDLTLRVSLDGAGGKFSTVTGVPVTNGSGWSSVVIPISAGDMVSVSDGVVGTPGFDINATLADVTEARILSSSVPAWRGDIITLGSMHLDNIEASTTLGITNATLEQLFSISPNPSSSSLNISIPQPLEKLKVEVFDVLGKQIYQQDISTNSIRINTFNWNNGVYIVRVHSKDNSYTKRFIKQ